MEHLSKKSYRPRTVLCSLPALCLWLLTLSAATRVAQADASSPSTPSPAISASTTDEEHALVLFDEGLTLADQADWKGAKTKLEEARRFAELPNIVFHLARAYLRLQEPERAMAALARFRELAGAYNPNNLEAERLMAENATPHAVAVPAPRTEPKKLPLGPLITVSSGGVALLVSLMTGLLAKAAEDELQRNCDSDGMCPSKLKSVRDHGERLKLTTNILLGVGGAAVAVGTGWWLLGRRERAPQAQASCTGVGCSVAARLRF